MTTTTCDVCGRRLTNEEHLFRHRQAHFTSGQTLDDALQRLAVGLAKATDEDDYYRWALLSPENMRLYLEDRERQLEQSISARRSNILRQYTRFSKAEGSSQGRADLAQLADDGVRLAHIQNELRRLRRRVNEDTSGRTPGITRGG